MDQYYKCYSYPLKRFIDVNGIDWMSKGYNSETERFFFVYVMTPELSSVLTAWTNTSPTKTNYRKEDRIENKH